MQSKTLLAKIRIALVYLWAALLVLLVPVFFFNLNGPLIEKIGRKIPIHEGNFSSQAGTLKADGPLK